MKVSMLLIILFGIFNLLCGVSNLLVLKIYTKKIKDKYYTKGYVDSANYNNSLKKRKEGEK